MPNQKNTVKIIASMVDSATAPIRSLHRRVARLAEPVRKVTKRMSELSRRSGLTGVVRGIARVNRSLRRSVQRAGAFGAKLLAVQGIAVYAFRRITQAAWAAGDALAKNADAAGLSVDAYAQLRFAAERAGVPAERFKSAMERLSKRVGEARVGTGALITILKKASPALLQQVNAAKSTEEAFTLIMKAMVKLEDPMNRVALANAAFSGAGMDMVKMAKGGMPEIERLRKEFSRLAGSQEGFARASEAAADASANMDAALAGFRSAVLTGFTPAIVKISDRVKEFLVANRGKLAEWADRTASAVNRWVQSGGLDRIAKSLEVLARAAGFAVKAIGVIAEVLNGVGGDLGYVAFIVYDVTSKTINAFVAAKNAVVDSWGALVDFFRSLWDRIGSIFDAGMRRIEPVISAARSVGDFLMPSTPHAAALQAEPERLTPLGATGVAATAQARPAQTHVTVDFVNAPRGMRARSEPGGTADLDLSTGYSMVTP